MEKNIIISIFVLNMDYLGDRYYERLERIGALEKSLDNAKTSERKLRLNYLLAKSYLSINMDGKVLYYYLQAQDLLEHIGENGLMGFSNFYRFRNKLENIEFFVYAKMDWMAV